MTLGQNGVLRYGHFSDFWIINGDRLTSKLVCISKSLKIRGKTNLKSISKNLAKMAINWQKLLLGQMPLWRMNI